MILFTLVTTVELETLVGLEAFALSEMRRRVPDVSAEVARAGRVAVRTRLDPLTLNALRTVVAAHLVEEFGVPRPRALLGQQQLSRIVETAQSVLQAHPPHRFRTVRLSAAGRDSSVFVRLAHELADALGLDVADAGGDLVVAVRRSTAGWQVLVRSSPRPLSARAWRVCDLPGALNATAASVMATLAEPSADETFVNIACGSATLLIERLAIGAARQAVGYDTDEGALECARANLAASRCSAAVVMGDARRLPHDDGSVRTVVGDLPYAMLLGSTKSNVELYPALVAEAARVLEPGGRLVLVTTQARLMAQTVAAASGLLDVALEVAFEVPHAHGVISPRIWLLQRL